MEILNDLQQYAVKKQVALSDDGKERLNNLGKFVRKNKVGLASAAVGVVGLFGTHLAAKNVDAFDDVSKYLNNGVKISQKVESQGMEFQGRLVRANGFPGSPDGQIELASGRFVNRDPLVRSHFAEPGGLLVGWDFPQSQIAASEGYAQRITPVSQRILDQDEGGDIPVNEGGFTFGSFGYANFTVLGNNGVEMRVQLLPGGEGHIHFVTVRGLYPAPGDRNRTIMVDYIAGGHNQWLLLAAPRGRNVAFWSEGQLEQFKDSAFHGDMFEINNNCGDSITGMCEGITHTLIDLNARGIREIGDITRVNRNGRLIASNY